MKRIIPFLMLAFALAACQDEGPTVPADGPQFAKPSCPGHPSCKDGDGDGGQYTTIDLQSLPIRKGPKQTYSTAHDITEPVLDPEGLLHVVVVGGSEDWAGGTRWPVVWTGTLGDIGDEPPQVLTRERGYALGISDDGAVIAGRLGNTGSRRPVAWLRLGDGWGEAHNLILPGGYFTGKARDVNISGMLAGTTHNASGDTVATVWESSVDPTPRLLRAPEGSSFIISRAIGLNNQGWVVGNINVPNEERSSMATLWKPDGTYCSLHPTDRGESFATRIDDERGGTVLVAGQVMPDMRPTIWTVNVVTCEFPPVEIVDIWAGTALDVRRVEGGGWEAVGADDTSHGGQAAAWTSSGESELLSDRQGRAFVVNSYGHIVGYREHKGLLRGVLWVKTTPP